MRSRASRGRWARTRARSRATGARPRRSWRATGGRIVAKGGAEGLLLAALTDRGLGLAIKCEDGASRPLGPAAIAVFERLGALREHERATLEALRRPVVRNVVGAEVGVLEPALREVALA